MGRHPGRNGVVAIAERWRILYRFFMHKSGWIIYHFDMKEDINNVLQGGQYFVFGIPIFFKIMPRCFLFNKDGRFILAWIQIHGLPPDCWPQKVLSVISSEVGKSLYTDSLKRTRERLEYAKLLVEVSVVGDRVHELPIQLPIGAQLDLKIIYKMVSYFCNGCRRIGHNKVNCHTRAALVEPQGNRVDHEAPGGLNGAASKVLNDLAIVVVHDPILVTVERPLGHVGDTRGAADVPPQQVPQHEVQDDDGLSTILEVSVGYDSCSSSVAPVSSTSSSSIVSVTLGSTSSSSLVELVKVWTDQNVRMVQIVRPMEKSSFMCNLTEISHCSRFQVPEQISRSWHMQSFSRFDGLVAHAGLEQLLTLVAHTDWFDGVMLHVLSETNTKAPAVEENNSSALTIVPTSTTTDSGTIQDGAFDPTKWELALATTPSNNNSTVLESRMLTLNSLYDEAAYRQHQQLYETPSSNSFTEPFEMSHQIATPPAVQMASMAQQQQQMFSMFLQSNSFVQPISPLHSNVGAAVNPFGDDVGRRTFPIDNLQHQPNNPFGNPQV
ncbi:hypothetical protein ZIOFF_030744 [Zingiber officinale]|uniref:DUF4283 domain-containing protein n=1 Tax=Zingiber officinale TaxID=94328 RepID=A0A8J5H0B7_ZINOF|nr:hypothetical protein ZIOFF_030744 [Zingiber officinale]